MKRPLMLLTMLLFAMPFGMPSEAQAKATATAKEGEALISDRDRPKLATLFAKYFSARKERDYKALTKTYESLKKDLEKRSKKVKVDTLLVSPPDMRAVFGAAVDAPPKGLKKGVIRGASGSKKLRSGSFDYNYLLRPPKTYKETQSFPIILFLHGAVSNPDKIEKEIESAIKAAYEDDLLDGVFVLAPMMKQGTDWMSLEGRMHAFFALLDAQASYSLNRLSVFVDGAREGAVASTQYASAYPGNFSGAIVRNMVGSPSETRLSNARHISMLLVSPKSGDSADLMTQFADTAKANQISDVTVVQSDFGDDDAPDAEALAAITKFVQETTKQVAPDKVQFTTDTLELANSYWLHLTNFKTSDVKPITVKGEINRATNEITVETPPRVASFIVYLNDDLVDMGKTIKVIHKITAGGDDEEGEAEVVFEGSLDRSLDRALTLWFENRSGNLGEVYTNWIEVEVPQG